MNVSKTVQNPTLGRMEVATRWDRGVRGKDDRASLHLYAASVAALMVGVPLTDTLPCVHCGTVYTWRGDGDVDRMVPGSAYRPGTCVMTCRACNETRDKVDTDPIDAVAYADAVVIASRMVMPMAPTAAARMVKGFASVPVRQGQGGKRWEANLRRSPWAV